MTSDLIITTQTAPPVLAITGGAINENLSCLSVDVHG
jgi:hypothetical protein